MRMGCLMPDHDDEYVTHDACPGSWCSTIACEDCGEMLTNPKPKDDGLVGICHYHGRGARGVLMRREDCLAQAPVGSNEADQ